MIRTLYWEDGKLYLLDQSLLPATVKYILCTTPEEVALAIRNMVVRGAPLIGMAAAYGVVLAAWNYRGPGERLPQYLEDVFRLLQDTRPTAVNLFWALERMERVCRQNTDKPPATLARALLGEAERMFAADLAANRAIGDYGEKLFSRSVRILTICNAGTLATCGYGTALGIVRSCFAKGKLNMVYACETRPVLQGARLTVWELQQDGIPVTLITDGMAGYLMQAGQVDGVVVGADRIAANGDTANKIGTYSLAVLAHYHQVPFYVAAPLTTIDFSLPSGRDIPIENRAADEVHKVMGHYITLPDVQTLNPAFDVTPCQLITAIITDRGVARPPYTRSLVSLLAGGE